MVVLDCESNMCKVLLDLIAQGKKSECFPLLNIISNKQRNQLITTGYREKLKYSDEVGKLFYSPNYLAGACDQTVSPWRTQGVMSLGLRQMDDSGNLSMATEEQCMSAGTNEN